MEWLSCRPFGSCDCFGCCDCCVVRMFAGVYRALSNVERLLGHRQLAGIVTIWLAVVVLCSAGLYVAENGVNQAVASPFDALWRGITTMTTVGYGDVYPITPEGRVAASLLMLLGSGCSASSLRR